MLFQSIYNWIKYKTLPSSILFKNRLFLERNSQTYRIFSSFGSTFRFSKWSSFSQINIKIKFQNVFFQLIFVLFFLLIFYLITFNYYPYSSIYNNISFLFWVNVDFFDYYFSFITWFVFFFISFFFNSLYSYFFFNNFSNSAFSDLDNEFSFKLKNNELSAVNFSKHNLLNLSKNDLNWNLYLWLNNQNSPSRSNNLSSLNLMFNLFQNSENNFWRGHVRFFFNLYKTKQTLLCLTQNLENSSILIDKVIENSHNAKTETLINSNNALVKFLLWTNILNESTLSNFEQLAPGRTANNYLKSKNTYLTQCYESNNSSFDYNFLMTKKNGFFYLLNFNYGQSSSNSLKLNRFNDLISQFDQFAINIKLDKWLYKYFLINRKSVKNLNKVTNYKKQFTNNLIDLNFFNKNLWNTQFFTSQNNFNFLTDILLKSSNSSLNAKFSNSLYLSVNEFANYNKNNGLFATSSFESSYYWLLKRFYYNNSLMANFFVSSLSPRFSTNRKTSANRFKTAHQDYVFLNQFALSSSASSTLATFYQKNALDGTLSKYSFFFKKQSDSAKVGFKSQFMFNKKDFYTIFQNNDYFTTNDLFFFNSILSNELLFNKYCFFKYLPLSESINLTDKIFKKNTFKPYRLKPITQTSAFYVETRLNQNSGLITNLYLLFFTK